MLKINQLKLPADHCAEQLEQEISRICNLAADQFSWRVVKKSIDARRKEQVLFVYTIEINIPDKKLEKKISRHKNIIETRPVRYQFPAGTLRTGGRRPVIIGSGPAGLFCALMLAEQGAAPIVLERGKAVEQRAGDVAAFWQTGQLNPDSNVQFGEGGAGTFSDGKLNTLVKDKTGRNKKVLETFVKFGAPEDILIWNKPHIGTDILIDVVRNMRNEIIRCGGEVRFDSCVTDFDICDGRLTAVVINGQERLETDMAVLAVGHSARDTFQILQQRGVAMEAKSFAVGVRVEHPQAMIQTARYGGKYSRILPAADYKVAKTLDNGRGVYSFCMCPGGYIVNASSEPERLAVNGMSYRKRNGKNANSAIIVSVTPADFPDSGPLSGVRFQQQLEAAAYACASGAVPVQLFTDYCADRISTATGDVEPQIKGSWDFGNVRGCFPAEIAASIEAGMRWFGTQIPGFDRPDALLSGVESRTSSPVRISRNEQFQSNINGLYPCGEGAGYAGGITSAAMDGIKVAEVIALTFIRKI